MRIEEYAYLKKYAQQGTHKIDFINNQNHLNNNTKIFALIYFNSILSLNIVHLQSPYCRLNYPHLKKQNLNQSV